MAAKTRSPNYPVIDLSTALGLTERIYAGAQRHPVPVSTVIDTIWAMKVGSSYGAQCVAALGAFGLISLEGTKDKRQLRVTKEAAKIIEKTPERGELLKQAALGPRVHRAVWSHYQTDGLPPDATIQHYLLFDYPQPFNKGKVAGFIKQLRSTIEFAGILPGAADNGGEGPEESGDADEIGEGPANRGTGRDGSGESRGGEPAGDSGGQLPPIRPGVKQDVFTLSEGEVVLRWPASLSQASFEDFEAWIDLMKRKIQRAVADDE